MRAPRGGRADGRGRQGAVPSRRLRQLLIAAAGLAIVAAVALLTPGRHGMASLSLGTAYAGLALLGASLAIGPWHVLRGRTPPPSNMLRRDIGIGAGIFALAHVVFGLQVHFGGDMLVYFFHRRDGGLVPRLDAFGAANDLGLAATLVLVLLLALSNNWSLRRLKAGPWKALQRSNYAAALLVLAHGAIYQLLERREAGFVLFFLGVSVAVAAAQLAGALRRRRGMAPRSCPAPRPSAIGPR